MVQKIIHMQEKFEEKTLFNSLSFQNRLNATFGLDQGLGLGSLETCHVSGTFLFPNDENVLTVSASRKVSTVSKYLKSWSKLEFETVENPCLRSTRK
jgi:hypothetical protein